MDLDVVLLSRIQFAFTISFHIIFPSFTIGLAAWLALLEGRWLLTGNPYYRQLFDFWLKVFGVSFGMGVVSGIVMAFQFGTNWAVLSERTGPIQGPLLGYETFTAFLLEATFFGVMLFGRERVPPWFYWLSCCMVALGTTFSAYWILMNNSWMQVPVGYEEIDGRFVPADWAAIAFSQVAWIRFLHMLIGAYLTSAMCIAAAGAWLLLRGKAVEQSRIMMRSGLGLVAVLIWPQMILGHFNGDYVHDHQPAKFAAIEARWQTEQPASEVLIGIPDPDQERNLYAIEIPRLGSFIASGTWDSREVGLEEFAAGRPAAGADPVLRLSHHGRHGPAHAGPVLVRRVALAPQAAVRGQPVVPVAGVPQLSERVHRRADRLVRGRGRPPALGGVRPAAHERRALAEPGRERRPHLAHPVRRGLQPDLRLGRLVHLPDPAGRAGGGHSTAAAA